MRTARRMFALRRFVLLVVLCLTFAVGYLCLFINSAWAVVTPYDKTPAAMITQDYNRKGLVWDYEIADRIANNPNRRGFVAAVLDFCRSGGFVNELSALANVYVATACDWDEYSFGVFGQRFMNESKTQNLHQSFETAKAAVSKWQSPQEREGGLGDLTLHWLTGDRALLFAADDPTQDDFWQDITVARDALRTRPFGQWPTSSIEAYFGDGKRIFADGIRVTGAATRANLFGALDASLDPTRLLFLYLNDHGVSTDVLKSRYRDGRYEYEVTTSLYRNEGDAKYGIWKVRHRVPDPDKSHYKNIQLPKAGWDVEIIGDWMEWFSKNPGDPSTWLVSGVDYPFGYDYPVPPKKVEWDDWVRYSRDGSDKINDKGWPDGSAWGSGFVVYTADQLYAPDPAQWPGWDNGGDGWVLAPAWAIPEPATLFLFSCGWIPLIPIFRRVRK
ncbi:MAG: hypothetical protein KatS3mg023_1748 [Armatimonadota bacterium]|nr:MAG: hypothetical protein KatS3mg023_1748 [Armatimonadota bacterium]